LSGASHRSVPHPQVNKELVTPHQRTLAFQGNRIAVRFAYEWHDDSGHWFRSYGNENWEFDEHALCGDELPASTTCRFKRANVSIIAAGRRPHPSELGDAKQHNEPAMGASPPGAGRSRRLDERSRTVLEAASRRRCLGWEFLRTDEAIVSMPDEHGYCL
jgi:hypothetical protein